MRERIQLTQAGRSFSLALCILLGRAQTPMGGYPVKVQNEVWTTYINSNNVNDLAIDGNYLWAATEGGIVRWDVTNGTSFRYTAGYGLIDNDIETIAIDQDSSKWFGTWSGVSHFDGTTWTTYDTSSSGLADNWVMSIAVDSAGSKWFGTWSGVSHFNGTTWTTYNTSNSGLASDYVTVIVIDNVGGKWFGTGAFGVSYFDGTLWRTYDTSNSGLADDRVMSIAVDRDGSKWFGTNGGGVSHFDGTIWRTYDTSNSGLANDGVVSIAVDRDGSKWFGTRDGVSHFDGATWTTYDTSNSDLADSYVWAIAIDNDGGKWFGFGFVGYGISKFDGNTWKTYATADDLLDNAVRSVTVEHSGGKWLGTRGGASWLVGSHWLDYTVSNSDLKSNNIQAIAIDHDGTVWFGTGDYLGGGVSHFNGTTWITYYDTFNSGLADDDVEVIAIDNDSGKWFGFDSLSEAGVSYFSGITWTTYNTSNSGLADNDVRAIAVDLDGSKWFGTNGGGVSRFDGVTWTTYDTSNSELASDYVWAIAIDDDGSKWFGTRDGVSHFDGAAWTTYDTSNSDLANDRVIAIAIDLDGSKWFGTDGGVSHFNGMYWRTYNTSNSGLTDNEVYAVAVDNNGTKWFGTKNGLSRFGHPPETETWVRVVDEGGTPLSGAWVYRNGTLIADSDGMAYQTNALGFLLVNGLDPSDCLVALVPRHKQLTTRTAHGSSGQNWAYAINVTNADLDPQGHITTTQMYDPATGEYLLTTARDNILVTFNVVVSIEWDAEEEYLTTVADAFGRASDYLYDVTDGQMAFGQVTIYDNAQHWADADFQISTKNTVRPYAFIGGITSGDTAHSIRVGRFWNGSSGNQGEWNEPYGYRTLIHEFGHYGLYLYDEYFVRLLDAEGHFTGEARAACTGLDVLNNASDATNASLMYYQYNASELADSDRWTVNCRNTEQARVNGEPDWQTVMAHYGGTEWVLNTPSSRGSVMAGPEAFPSHLLPFPTVEVHNAGPGGSPRQLAVVGPEGHPFPNALVALYTTPHTYTVAIDQGLTDQQGHLTVYGAVERDTIQAASFDGAYAGAVTVDGRTAYTLTLSPTSAGRLAARASSSSPYLNLIPGSEGDTLLLEVHGAPTGSLPLSAVVIPGEGGGSPQSTSMAYSAAKDAYVGQVSLAGVGLGSGEVRVSGVAGGRWVSINSDYNLLRVLDGQANGLASEDGNFQLHVDAGSLLNHADAYAVVLPTGYVPGPLPVGKRVLGSAYEVRFSGAATGLTKPGLLAMYYHPEVMGLATDLAIYHWNAADEEWERVGGEQSELDNSVAAPVEQFGIYALMGEPFRVYLPVVLKQ